MAKKGRKRNVTARRKPSGYIPNRSNVEREREIVAVGLEARERLFSLSRERARDTAAGTHFGRAYLKGELAPNDAEHNRKLYEAGLEFERRRRAYLSAIAAKGVPSAGDLDRVHGFDGDEPDELVEARQRAMRRYSEIRREVLELGQACRCPLAMFAIETWVVEDKPVWELLGDLRTGLNAVARVVDNETQGTKARLTV